MTLEKYPFKTEYDSVADDVYGDFLIKALSRSEEYSRFGGVFSSKNFALCAEGLQEFINNEGHMKLIISPMISKEDASAINEGLLEKSKFIEDEWISEIKEIKEKFVKDHAKALGWMLKNGFLEIKIAQITDQNGKIVDSGYLENINFSKEKFGIFWDGTENGLMTFSGVIDYENEKFGNYYHLDIHRKWKGETAHCDKFGQRFRQYWTGEKTEIASGYFLTTIDFPNAIKQHLIEIAPESKSEINLERPLYLRKHQRKAVDAWIKNNFRGIFEMATGTGKTIAAMGAIKEILKKEEKIAIVVVCPTDTLVSQWKEQLEKWGMTPMLTPGNSKWYEELKGNVTLLNGNEKSTIYIITSYDTLSNIKFQNNIKKIQCKKLLIADEVHNAGAPIYQLGLIENFNYRLGLTATPKRYFDDEGTDFLLKYFEDIVFSYPLEKAIDDGWLVPYYYYTKSVQLTTKEFEKYRAYSITMAETYQKKNKDKSAKKRFENAANGRSRIIQNAENKINALNEVIDEIKELKFALIFTAPALIDEIQKKLSKRRPPIFTKKVTHKDTPKREQRAEIFAGLQRGAYDAILAIMIMDEGVDIPALKTSIIVSSTGNPKQFIQRRGRVLRPYSGKYPDGTYKTSATIIDFHVFNDIPEDADEDQIKIEQGMAKKELKRFEEMASIAINSTDSLAEIKKIRKKYKI